MTETCVAKCKDGSECEAYPLKGRDKCRMHAGRNGDSHDGNDWAAKHGAWSESFVTDFLREDEIARVENAADVLGQPEGAQALARQVAAIALEQFRRTGDDRFLRRYVQISEKFGLTPPEEMHVEHSGSAGIVIHTQADDGDD